MSAPSPDAPKVPAWVTCLDVESQDGDHYGDYVNAGLLQGIPGSPERVLELGCAAGAFGRALKEKYPSAHVTGVEASRAAAAVAATRIDRVITARLEDLDFAAEGIAPGTFDVVVAGDVLEHVVNPWQVLLRVRPYIAPGGVVVASIPNIRNLHVLGALLLNGRFEYRDKGLLDITHLRFFTLTEINRMFEETGYVPEDTVAILSPGLESLYNRSKADAGITIKVDRLTITDVTRQELTELCADGFVVRARLRA